MMVYRVLRREPHIPRDEYFSGGVGPGESAYPWVRRWWLGPPRFTFPGSSRSYPVVIRVRMEAVPYGFAALTAGGRPVLRCRGFYHLLDRRPWSVPSSQANFP